MESLRLKYSSDLNPFNSEIERTTKQLRKEKRQTNLEKAVADKESINQTMSNLENEEITGGDATTGVVVV